MITESHKLEWSRQVGRHLFEFYLPFWHGPAMDLKHGGWMGWLDNDLRPDRTKPKGLIVHARILWSFSAAFQARPDPTYKTMAERAYAYLMEKFWDPKHGGAYWRVNDEGKPLEREKKCYGQAFVIYALAEFHRAFGHSTAMEKALVLFDLLENHAHDQKHGGYLEVFSEDWSDAPAGARLSERDMAEKKSMNNHLHMLEALTNLYRIWPNPRVKFRLVGLFDLFLQRILNSQTWHLHHFFDEAWRVRSETYTFGHDIEASWLLEEAAAAIGDEARRRMVRAAALGMAACALNEGLGIDGALCYEGRDGRILDSGHECWPQAEAMVGFLNAYELDGQEKYLAAAMRTWNYTQTHLADFQKGEWFWRINPDGKPDPHLPKVSEWKGPYHVTRACLEIMKRIPTAPSNATANFPVGGKPAKKN